MGDEPGSWVDAFRKQYDEVHGPYNFKNIYEIDEELFIYADALQAESKRRKRMQHYKLIIFDMNGTITNTPFIDKQPLQLLPGRLERCQQLQEEGIILAIASNQGGVAFGFLSEVEADQEVCHIASLIGTPYYDVAYGHPKPRAGYERYASPEYIVKRKPEPGMLNYLMAQAQVSPSETLMVGDREEDEQAARAARIAFMWADEFFR